jgi:hypothetical protein
MVDSDIGVLINFASSTASGVTVTSTNGQHIAANTAPVLFSVSPYAQLFVAST